MRKSFYIIVSALLIASSCTKESLKTAWSTQEDRIDSFIGQYQGAATVTHYKGSNRVSFSLGTGEALKEGGTVSFYYAGYVFSGSISAGNMFATNYEERALTSGWDVTDPDYSVRTVTLGEDDGLVEGLHNGLTGVRAGEVCYILFSGQYGFGEKKVGTIPGNSALLYEIWVESVTN